MTHNILPHVLNSFSRISSYGMYPVHVPGPKPAGITTPNDLTVFLPLLLSIFKLLLKISHPSPFSASCPIRGIFICSSLKRIVRDGDNETRNEQAQSNAGTGISARALLGL